MRTLHFPLVLLLSLAMLKTIWDMEALENTKFLACKVRGLWSIDICSITINSGMVTFPNCFPGSSNYRYIIHY